MEMFRHILYLSLIIYADVSGYHFHHNVFVNTIDDPTMFPFFSILSISENKSIENSTSCGGSLIHLKWILTAGHCFPHGSPNFGLNSPNITHLILVGYTHFPSLTIVRQVRKISRIIRHPYYIYDEVEHPTGVAVLLRNDIALIEVERPFHQSEVVQVIPLAKLSRICKHAIAIGIGLSNGFDVHHSIDKVKYVKLDIRKHQNLNYSHYNPSSTVLYAESDITSAYSFKNLKHFTHDDSGGPVICFNVTPPIQIGVLSAVINRTQTGTVINIIERVDFYHSFISKYVPDVFNDDNTTRARKKNTKSVMKSGGQFIKLYDICFVLISFIVLFGNIRMLE